MKIVGQIAELSSRECVLFGCEPEVLIPRLNCDYALRCIAERRELMASNPLSSLSALGQYAIDTFSLWYDETIVVEAAAAVLAHETAQYLEIPHD